MKPVVGVIIALIIVGGGWYFYTNQQIGESMEKDGESMMEDAHDKEAAMIKNAFPYKGDLEDVSGGEATGAVKAQYMEGTYTLVATFEGLEDPKGTDFYEGWVVRRGDEMSVVSTGMVKEEEVGYVNLFTSDVDLTDHDFYVLTLEPDDGDPAPAAHIVEGELSK